MLGKNKLRTFLTAFGVFWGILMLILLLGTGNGLENGVNARFMNRASNTFFVWTSPTSKPYGGFSPGRRFQMNNDDLPLLQQNLKGISILAPRNQLGGFRGSNIVTRKDKTSAFSVNGDYPEIKTVLPIVVKNGRFINKADLAENRKVASIGERVYKLLFRKGENPIGEQIKINGIFFKVVGVFGSTASGDEAERYLNSIHVPFTTFQKVFNTGNKIDWLSVTVQDHISASVVEKQALELLAKKHEVDPTDTFAFGHFNMQEMFDKINRLFAGINLLMWIVGLGTLTAGVIGVSNIMLIVVKERTKEIGIRRAIGAPPAAIVRQILAESIFLTGLSGYVGLLTGILILEVVSSILAQAPPSMFRDPSVDISIALAAVAVLVIGGTLAGIIPAKKALAIKPVEALKDQ